MVAVRPVEQTGGSQDQGPGAHRGRQPGRDVGTAQPLEHALVVLQGPSAHPAREDDHVGRRELFEGAVGDEAEHAVVASNLAASMAEKGDVEGWNALQHFVRAHTVEGGETGEQGDGDPQCMGRAVHADVLSSATRKRRR